MELAFQPTDFLLPANTDELDRWPCIACDQYTSQRDYWERAERFVGEAPSTLRMIIPECWLSEAETRIPAVQQTMRDYLAAGILQTAVRGGYILTERTTPSGRRLGLVGAVDLEQYDFDEAVHPAIQPTELTVVERLPPRVAVRRGAPLETGHVMLLANDPMRTLIEPLYTVRSRLHCVYDVELMLSGGHLRGWAVTDAADLQKIDDVMGAQQQANGGALLFAVGDGNHSLAAAKRCWEEKKAVLGLDHPLRYAMCEVVNLYDEALRFEPIHRIVRGIGAAALIEALTDALPLSGTPQQLTVVTADEDTVLPVPVGEGELAVSTVQKVLDQMLKDNSAASIDYIHGEEAVRSLCADGGTVGLLLPPIDKNSFFDILNARGRMPRKTFSMGEADEKRFYMECRRLA